MMLFTAVQLTECRATEHGFRGNSVDVRQHVSLEDIIEIWKERRDRIGSVLMEWEGEITYGKGSLFWSPMKVAHHGGDPSKLPLVPESDVTFCTRGYLAWDRGQRRFKLQHNPPTWNAESGVHFQQDLIYSTDFECSMSFLGKSKSAPEQLRGYIRERDNEGLPGNVEVALIVTALFPYGERLSPVNVESEWTLRDRQVFFDGYPCLILEKRLSDFKMARLDAERSELLVVNPAMGFCVVRHTQLVGDSVHRQREFEYTIDDEYGWLPTRWTSLIVGKDKRVHQDLKHSVTNCDVHPTMTAEDLELTFPIDTWVKDARSEDEWIVRANGKRRITRAELERGATHTELIATKSGKARIRPTDWIQTFTIAIGVCICCVYFVFRSRSKKWSS